MAQILWRLCKKYIIMKLNSIAFFVVAVCMSDPVFCQDTSQNQKISKEHTYQVSSPSSEYTQPSKTHIYRDTRLGGSSPLYNTYKKNDYGAGAITNNPNKGSGEVSTYPYNSNSAKTTTKIYRDTRLGGSSPLYNTYKKNDNGAGSVTTNPNKGSGDSSPAPYISDSTTNGK
ncbi:MAG: hypothetical protein ABI359_07820 [Ginsengibacter sp.]